MSFEKPGPVEDNWRDAISSVEEIIDDARDGPRSSSSSTTRTARTRATS